MNRVVQLLKIFCQLFCGERAHMASDYMTLTIQKVGRREAGDIERVSHTPIRIQPNGISNSIGFEIGTYEIWLFLPIDPDKLDTLLGILSLRRH